MPSQKLHIALLEAEVPWNTGNAGRTALGLSAQLHLIKPLGFSTDDRAVRRAGLDYWPQVRPVIWDHWEAFEAALPDLGDPFFLSPDGAKAYWDVTYPDPCVLIFGKETAGLPKEVRETYKERLLSIPYEATHIRSLNLSTCVGIVGYEVKRQWAKPL